MQLQLEEQEKARMKALENRRLKAEAEKARLEAEEKARRDAQPVMINLDHLAHYKVTKDDEHHLKSGKLYFSPRSATVSYRHAIVYFSK